VNAILLRQGVSFNFPVAGERYRKIGEAMGLNLAGKGSREVESALIGELDRLQEAMGFTKRLSDVGVSPDDIPKLARMTMDDPNMATNPREPSLQDVEEIYARAL
jgi:alcohol dehydrogenase class IV